MAENEVQSASGAVKSVEDRIAALEKQGTWVSAVVRKVVSFLETAFGYDINADGKIGSARLGVLVGVALACMAGAALAAETNLWTLYNGDATYGTAKIEQNATGSAKLTVDSATITNLTAPNFSGRWDTNATTTATAYTPRRVGDILVGSTGGTNSTWIAKGTTTNDWVSYTLAFPSTASMAGPFTAGSLVSTGSQTSAAAAKTITNAAAIASLAARVISVSAVTASTNTLPAPGAAGELVTVLNGGTNNVTISAGGNIRTTNASFLARGYNVSFFAETATNWVPVSPVVNN